MEYSFERLPTDLRGQLVAASHGALVEDFVAAPLPGTTGRVVLAVVALAATAALTSRVASTVHGDPFASGTVAVHGVVLVGSALTAALLLVALVRRRLSPLKPCVVATPALVVKTGCAGDPIHVHRLDELSFERNETERLVLRFRDGEVAIPRLHAETSAVAGAALSRITARRRNPSEARAEDAWTRAFGEAQPGFARGAPVLWTLAALAGLLAGGGLWIGTWRATFAAREAQAWAGAERDGSSRGWAAYGDFAKKAKASVPSFVVAATRADERAALAATRRDDASYAESVKSGRADALAAYLESFAAGAHASEARALHEERLFAEATRLRSAGALRAAIAAYPRSKLVAAAQELIATLYDEYAAKYRTAGKPWVADLLAAVRRAGKTEVPVTLRGSGESEDEIERALEHAFARACPGELFTLGATTSSAAPRLLVNFKVSETGRIYTQMLIPDVPMPNAPRVAEKVIEMDLAFDAGGGDPVLRSVIALPPQSLSVETQQFLEAHPSEVRTAMFKALHAELERVLEAELAPR